MSLCLTAEELHELTGRGKAVAQRRWLDRNGWRYALNADGRPKVLKVYAEQRLGLSAVAAPAGPEPDFTVFRKAA